MKYYFLNDINYIFQRRKKILLCLILFPLIIAFINSNLGIPTIDTINLIMGTNLNLNEYTVIQILMYLFNVVFYLFLIMDLYIKDIRYQLDNIFLREKNGTWFLKKTLLFMIIMFALKMIQYITVTIVVLSNKNNVFNFDIIKLLTIDYIYINLVNFMFLLGLILIIAFPKIKMFTAIVFLLLVVVFPKNIWLLKNKLLLLIFILLIIQMLIYLLFKKKPKKIMENI